MDWTQFTTFLITNTVFSLTLWLWNRSESRNDIRLMLAMIDAIQKEIKDFHGRLCALEEKGNKYGKDFRNFNFSRNSYSGCF